MPAANDPTVSNTSPLLNLAIIDALHFAREQFRTILIPPVVQDELYIGKERPGSSSLRAAIDEGWIQIRDVENIPLVQTLLQSLDRGEAYALALAVETRATRILLDEREGRKHARRLDLPVTGVLGILLKAHNEGRLDSIEKAIRRLRTEAGFWIAPALEKRILRNAQ